MDNGTTRTFESGATRDTSAEKLEYGGFLSPLVLHRFATYMHKHRRQSDGSLRSSRNWQKGIPAEVYTESLIRHNMDFWLWRENFGLLANEDFENSLCGIIFNAQGLLFEHLSKNYRSVERQLDSLDGAELANDIDLANDIEQSQESITAREVTDFLNFLFGDLAPITRVANPVPVVSQDLVDEVDRQRGGPFQYDPSFDDDAYDDDDDAYDDDDPYRDWPADEV